MSRNLDALCAERVLRRTIDRGDDGKAAACVVVQQIPYKIEPAPQYSTDIAAAWELVEHREFMGLLKMKLGYSASFFDIKTGIQKNAESPSAPKAITIAACRACGVTDEEIEEALK